MVKTMNTRHAVLNLMGTFLLAGPLWAAPPKVMLLVDEKSLGTLPTSEVEAMGVALLLERGIPTVDQEMVRANVKKQQNLLKSVGDNRGAAALGMQFGADVVIVGEAVSKPSARRIAESNLRTYQAVVTLRAVRADNSENLASASEESSIVGLEDVSGSAKALKTAARPALESVLDQLQVRWEAPANAPARISLSIGGVDQAWKLKALRDQLRNLKDISSVVQKNYAAGAVVFEIVSALSAEQLAEKIVLGAGPDLGLQTLEVAPASIQLRAVERSP